MSTSSKVLLVILISLRVWYSRVAFRCNRLKENFEGNDRKEIKRPLLFIIRTAIRSRKITPGFHQRQREAEIRWIREGQGEAGKSCPLCRIRTMLIDGDCFIADWNGDAGCKGVMHTTTRYRVIGRNAHARRPPFYRVNISIWKM